MDRRYEGEVTANIKTGLLFAIFVGFALYGFFAVAGDLYTYLSNHAGL